MLLNLRNSSTAHELPACFSRDLTKSLKWTEEVTQVLWLATFLVHHTSEWNPNFSTVSWPPLHERGNGKKPKKQIKKSPFFVSAFIEVTSCKLLLSLFHCKVAGNVQVIYIIECYEITQGMVTQPVIPWKHRLKVSIPSTYHLRKWAK